MTRRKYERGGPVPAAEAGGGEGRTLAGARVLVVDDDRVDRLVVRRMLAGVAAGFEIDEADGVLVAIERLTGTHFDCVLLDYNLPDGDGLTFLRGLRTAGIEVPVVMLTGQEDAAVADDLIRSGAAGYLPKNGLSAELLISTLRDAIGAAPRVVEPTAGP